MEFKLKDGWFDYFFSGFFAGIFLMVLTMFQLRPDVIDVGGFVNGVVVVLASVVAFIMGCRVKKRTPQT